MDRARDAARLWRASVGLYEQRPEVFVPGDVSAMSTGAVTALLREAGVKSATRAGHQSLVQDCWQLGIRKRFGLSAR